MISDTSGSARYRSIGPYPSTSSVMSATTRSRSSSVSGMSSLLINLRRARGSRRPASLPAVSDESKSDGPIRFRSACSARRLSRVSGSCGCLRPLGSCASVCARPASATVASARLAAGRLLDPFAELHSCTFLDAAFRRFAGVAGVSWGASRCTSWVIAERHRRTRIGLEHGHTVVERHRHRRELGIATSTLTPTAVSIAPMVSPVRASARFRTKCHC